MKHITTETTTPSRAGMSVLLSSAVFICGFQHPYDTLGVIQHPYDTRGVIQHPYDTRGVNIFVPVCKRDNKLVMKVNVTKLANGLVGAAWSGDCSSKVLGKIL